MAEIYSLAGLRLRGSIDSNNEPAKRCECPIEDLVEVREEGWFAIQGLEVLLH